MITLWWPAWKFYHNCKLYKVIITIICRNMQKIQSMASSSPEALIKMMIDNGCKTLIDFISEKAMGWTFFCLILVRSLPHVCYSPWSLTGPLNWQKPYSFKVKLGFNNKGRMFDFKYSALNFDYLSFSKKYWRWNFSLQLIANRHDSDARIFFMVILLFRRGGILITTVFVTWPVISLNQVRTSNCLTFFPGSLQLWHSHGVNNVVFCRQKTIMTMNRSRVYRHGVSVKSSVRLLNF